MSIKRSTPPTPHTDELSRKLGELYGPCIQCKDCHGLCPSLIEALMLPDMILKTRTTKS